MSAKRRAAVGFAHGGASMDQVALAWLLRHPARMLPILGTGKLERIKRAVGAEDLALTRQQWFTLWTASTGAPVPQGFGDEGRPTKRRMDEKMRGRNKRERYAIALRA